MSSLIHELFISMINFQIFEDFLGILLLDWFLLYSIWSEELGVSSILGYLLPLMLAERWSAGWMSHVLQEADVVFCRSLRSRQLTVLCIPFVSLLILKFTYPINHSGRGAQISDPDCEFVCFSLYFWHFCIMNLYCEEHTHLGKIPSTKWTEPFIIMNIPLCL